MMLDPNKSILLSSGATASSNSSTAGRGGGNTGQMNGTREGDKKHHYDAVVSSDQHGRSNYSIDNKLHGGSHQHHVNCNHETLVVSTSIQQGSGSISNSDSNSLLVNSNLWASYLKVTTDDADMSTERGNYGSKSSGGVDTANNMEGILNLLHAIKRLGK